LLVWRQHDHAPGLVVVQGCEYPAVHPEVRVPHVGALDGVGQAEHDATEVFGVRHRLI